MSLDDLKALAAGLDWPAERIEDSDQLRLEIPRGSRTFVVARAKMGAILINASLVVPEEHRNLFLRSDSNSVRALQDIASYLCLFDVEHELDLKDHAPSFIGIATRWDPATGRNGLMSVARLVLRCRQGVIHRFRYWIEVLKQQPQGVAP